MAGTNRTINVRLMLNTSQYEAGANRAAHATTGIAGAARSVTKPLAAAGAALGGFKILSSVMEEGNNFTNALNTMGAVSGATAPQMDKVSEAARALGKDSTIAGASSVDAASAMTELAKAGFTVDEAMAAAKGTLQLAAAAQIDAAKAAEIEANAMNAFGLKAKDAGMVADMFANAANASSAEITDFAQSLQAVGAVANQFGVSIQDTTTALGLFANAGIKGSDAGTMLKTGLLALANPSGPAAEAIKKLGLVTKNSAGEFVGLKSIFGQLAKASKHMTQMEYNQATAAVFGTDAARMAGLAANTTGEQWDKMATSLGKTGGAADLAAAKMKGLPGVIEALNNSLSDAKLSLYMAFGPLATGLLQILSAGLDAVAPHLEKFGNWAGKEIPKAFAAGKVAVQSFMAGFKTGDAAGLEGIQLKIAQFGAKVREVWLWLKPLGGNVASFASQVVPAFADLVRAAAPLAESMGQSLILSFRGLGATLQASAPLVAGLLRLIADTLNALMPVLRIAAPVIVGLFAAFRGVQQIRGASSALLGFSRQLGSGFANAVGAAARSLAMFNMRQGGTLAQGVQWHNRIQAATRVARGLGTALPFVGVAFAVFGGLLEAASQRMQQAKENGANLATALRQGGDAARNAGEKIADMKSKLKSGDIDLDTFVEYKNTLAGLSAAQADYAKNATVSQRLDDQATAAKNNLLVAIREFGPASTQAATAGQTYKTAVEAQQQADLAATAAAHGLTLAQQEKANATANAANAAMAEANANIAAAQANTSAVGAINEYKTAMADSNITAAERQAKLLAMDSALVQVISSTYAAAGGDEKAAEASKAATAEANNLATAFGIKLPPQAAKLVASMQASGNAVMGVSGAADILKDHIIGVPNEKTVRAKGLTADAIQKLRDVGLAVQAIPGSKDVYVTTYHLDQYGHDATGVNTSADAGHNAKGGWIHGPGSGTSDSIPTWLSNNEFVVNAKDAQRNAAALERINNGGDIMPTAGGGKPGAARYGGGKLAGGGSGPAVIMLTSITTLDGKVVARTVNRVNADLDRRR